MDFLLATINGIPNDLFYSRVLIAVTCYTGAILAMWNTLVTHRKLIRYIPKWARVLNGLWVFMALLLGTIMAWGAIDPFPFPNPDGVRIAITYTIPFLIVWHPIWNRVAGRVFNPNLSWMRKSEGDA